MKLYEFPDAPNCFKVNVYLREKGLDIPRKFVDLRTGAHKTPEFLAINPRGQVPVLELDDGRHIDESLAIIQYLEELNPDPNLIGTTPEERAVVHARERFAEFSLFIPAMRVWFHSSDFFKDRFPQIPAVAEREREAFAANIRIADGLLADAPFFAGESCSIADTTAFAALTKAMEWGLPDLSDTSFLARWYDEFQARPQHHVAN